MPPLPAVPGVLRVQFKHSSSLDLDVLNRVFMQYTGTWPTSANLSTMAATVFTAWGTDLKALAPNAVTLEEVVIQDLTSSSAGVGLHTGSTAGTRGTSLIPAASSALVNLSVARRYRGGKPRVYLPYGVSADLNGTQNWTTAFQGALLTGWNAWIAAIIAAAPGGTTITQQVNVSYYEGFTVVTNPVTGRARNVPTLRSSPVVDAVVASAVSLVIASQRRRNRA